MTSAHDHKVALQALAYGAPFGYCEWRRLSPYCQELLLQVVTATRDSEGVIARRHRATEDKLIWDWFVRQDSGEHYDIYPIEDGFRGIQFPGSAQPDGSVTTRVLLVDTHGAVTHFDSVPVNRCLFIGCYGYSWNMRPRGEVMSWTELFSYCAWCAQQQREEGA